MEGYAVQSGTQETRKRLKKAGFKADSLEAMTEVLAGMEERLATKEDLAKAEGVLKQDIADVRTEIRQEVRDRLEGFRQEVAARMEGMQSQIEALRSEMHALRDGLRSEMRTIKWVLGGMFALMVPMLAGIIGIALQLARQ